MLLKSLSRITLISVLLLLLMPLSALAEDTEQKKGSINWKVDRIIEKDSDKEQNHSETELEKRFPELFKEETSEAISSVQENKQKSLDQLEQDLFATDLPKNTTIEDTKEILFAEDYVAPQVASSENPSDNSGGFSIFFMALTGIAVLMSGGIYVMYQRFVE
ncbi:type VII secretion protein EssA [Gracilibacillus kekensis]|uniref:Type VII secretion protein EssA n=1 Tax=Gracilibacillus kekensis TaxID=1027249 RepID=A0A1M7JQC0_9BACI|nr:type VII secretion protein EssA [Gracilibacillus kekensis]SHM55105.1 type VII secretion protein EssA [Gracilibacillus kekensis]